MPPRCRNLRPALPTQPPAKGPSKRPDRKRRNSSAGFRASRPKRPPTLRRRRRPPGSPPARGIRGASFVKTNCRAVRTRSNSSRRRSRTPTPCCATGPRAGEQRFRRKPPGGGKRMDRPAYASSILGAKGRREKRSKPTPSAMRRQSPRTLPRRSTKGRRRNSPPSLCNRIVGIRSATAAPEEATLPLNPMA